MAEPIGILGGSAFLGGPLLAGLEERRVATERGDVACFRGDGFVLLPRHGAAGNVPPHRVDHHAHTLALKALGIRRVAGFCSVGGLDANLALGAAVVARDYLSVFPPPTSFDDEATHIVPGLSEEVRALLLAAARRTDGPVVDGGVYVETRGPRFETRAEVRFYRTLGDVVGMTGASEATLMQEQGLDYALVGIVDNLAHGLAEEPLTYEEFRAQVVRNEGRVRAILEALLAAAREEEP